MVDFSDFSFTPDSTAQMPVEVQEKAGGNDCGRQRSDSNDEAPDPDKADENNLLICVMDEVSQGTYD